MSHHLKSARRLTNLKKGRESQVAMSRTDVPPRSDYSTFNTMRLIRDLHIRSNADPRGEMMRVINTFYPSPLPEDKQPGASLDMLLKSSTYQPLI